MSEHKNLMDLVAQCSSVKYNTDLTWQSPSVVKFLNWMGQVFPDMELLIFFLKDMASCLDKHNLNKRIRVWIGAGDNSKSMVAKLFQLIFGDHCVHLPSSVLTHGFCSEIVQARNAHVAFISDFEGKTSQSALKKLRDEPFKIITMCNSMPPNQTFIYIPFVSTWTDDAPENPVEQHRQGKFKKDTYFEKQLPELAEAALWVMVQYYPIYQKKGLKLASIMLQYAKDHLSQDPITQFIDEYY